MTLLLGAVLIGLVAGILRPPLGARATRIRVRCIWLLAVGAAGSAAAQLVEADLAPAAMGVSLALLLAFVLTNAHLTGIAVIGVGLLLNLLSVVVNNGMPVRGEALVQAGVVEADELATTEVNGARHLETATDRLPVLGDVLPIPAVRSVISFGDLIVMFGVADALRDLARRRRRGWTKRDRGDYESAMTQLRAVHDWGTAPSGAPDSGSQNSANPDRDAPVTIDLTSDGRTSGSRPLVPADHSR